MTPSAEQAYSKLAERCSSTELCTGEALDKLRLWGIDSSDAYRIVQRLVNERFIDDERFAGIWVRDKLYNARWGVLKIRNSLRLKRIDSDIIDAAIAENLDSEQYYENLQTALRAKARSLPSPLTYETKMKLARFAINRGYEPRLVQELLNDEFWRDDNDL